MSEPLAIRLLSETADKLNAAAVLVAGAYVEAPIVVERFVAAVEGRASDAVATARSARSDKR